MTANIANPSLGNKLFGQLQTLLTETGLIEETGRHISGNVQPDYSAVRLHLTRLFEKSSDPWANLFRRIYQQKLSLYFDRLAADSVDQWPTIINYSVFKQWADFFQFIGMGFLLDYDHFIPESAITDSMCNDSKFVARCLKAIGDPRCITAQRSLHTAGDSLRWTKGEDHLPLTDDVSLHPRIPLELVLQEWRQNMNQLGAWRSALEKAHEAWRTEIFRELSQYPFSDPLSFVYTAKHVLDFFIFGRLQHDTDFLDKERLHVARNRWSSIPGFKLSRHIWQNLPSSYSDISRLYWGICYYRTSLRNPSITRSRYDEAALRISDMNHMKALPIRCTRSKRSLFGLFKTCHSIYKALSTLVDNGTALKHRERLNDLISFLSEYLPSDSLERLELLDDLEQVLDLEQGERKNLLLHPDLTLAQGSVDSPVINLCARHHQYLKLVENPHVVTIQTVQKRLDTIKRQLISDMRLFETPNSGWREACIHLKHAVSRKDFCRQ